MQKNNSKSIAYLASTFIPCLIVIFLFALPLIFSLQARFEYLGESVTYRYFSSARIIDGEGRNIWLPQGYLVSLMQHVIFLISSNDLSIITPELLRQSLNKFGFLTNGAIVFINSSVIIYGFFCKSLLRIDHLILAIVSLVPVYCFGDAGFYYSTLPDYYHMNMVLVTAATMLFLLGIRRLHDVTRVELFSIGVFIGLCVSNKITMLAISGAVVLSIIPRTTNWGLKRWLLALTLITSAAISTFSLVFLAFYLFQWGSVLPTLLKILNFSLETWIQPNFSNLFVSQFFDNGFIYAIILFVIVTATHFILFYLNHRHSTGNSGKNIHLRGRYVIVTGLIFIGFLQLFFVLKRPADTTLFESSVGLISVSSLLVFLFENSRVRQLFLSGFVIIFLHALFSTYGILNKGYGDNPELYSHSLVSEYRRLEQRGTTARAQWQAFEKVQNLRKKITVVIPDNEYFWREGDPFEVLLKGTVDFPTWQITSGKRYLERLQAPLSYRSEQMNIKPDHPYTDSEVLVWFDRKDLLPLTKQYLSINHAAIKRDCSYEDVNKWVRLWICVPKMQ